MSGPVVGAMRRDSNGTCYEPLDILADTRCRNLERIKDKNCKPHLIELLKITQNGKIKFITVQVLCSWRVTSFFAFILKLINNS